MAYQKSTNEVISLLKETYPNKNWKEIQDRCIIFTNVMNNFGNNCLAFDEVILRKVIKNVYNGLTLDNYIVPLTEFDTETDLRS